MSQSVALLLAGQSNGRKNAQNRKNPAVQTQAGDRERTAKVIAFAGVCQVSAL